MKRVAMIIMGLLTLAGCASQGLTDAQKSNVIEQFITSQNLQHKSSVNAFNMDSWTSLNDQYLILRTSPFKPYLVKLVSRCQDLSYAPRLLIQSRMSSSLSEGFDSVYTPENQAFKCYISRIYPLSKEQNKALIDAVNPSEEDKPLENPAAEADKNKVKTLQATETE